MSETETTTVKTETVKASVWVPDPVLTLVLAALCVGVMAGVVAEKRGYLDGLEKKQEVITGNAEVDARLLQIIKAKSDLQWERWLRQDAELRKFIDTIIAENMCRCRHRGMSGEAGMPVGAPPAPAPTK